MEPKAVLTSTEEPGGRDYLTRSGVARLLGVSPNTVTRWAREGRIPSQLTLGGHHRFERAVIESIRADMRRAVGTGPAVTKPPDRG
jgi:excisionase family DNA binding protein